MTEPLPHVVVEPPLFSDSDDEAWERLFAELTGGTEEVHSKIGLKIEIIF